MADGERRSELIARREYVGHTHETLATEIGASVSAVSSWERGLRTPRGRLRRELARALEINLAQLDHLLDPATPPALNGHDVPRWLTLYESLVHSAGAVHHVEKTQVPGLLQTPAYAALIERIGPIPLTDDQVHQRVEIRTARQHALTRPDNPLRLTALISQTVLDEQIGTPQIMAEQLDHLDRASRTPNIEIRLIPPDGSSAAAPCGFELLTQPGHHTPFLAVYFATDGPHYVEQADTVTAFTTIFDYLERLALPATESRRLIQTINKERYQ
jgi:transcriptional regulator with XRE-family HTH domain